MDVAPWRCAMYTRLAGIQDLAQGEAGVGPGSFVPCAPARRYFSEVFCAALSVL